jgi:uncharacterized membrane-anchored protein
MEMTQNNKKHYFWGGLIRLILGIIFAYLSWIYLLMRGNATRGKFGIFALSVALALSGLIVLLTQKTFSELSASWDNLPGLQKVIFTIFIVFFLYMLILFFGAYISVMPK